MQEFDFHYNFNETDLLGIRDEFGITRQEIISVFENPKTRVRGVKDEEFNHPIYISIGYGSEKRILKIAFAYPNETIDFIDAALPSEDDIDQFYCNG